MTDTIAQMRAVLIKCAEFVEAECERRASSGGLMTDYVGEAEALLAEIDGVLERRGILP